MASSFCNETVELYRKIVKQEQKLERLQETLNNRVGTLNTLEMNDYVRMTREIDEAEDKGYNLNKAGLDRSKI